MFSFHRTKIKVDLFIKTMGIKMEVNTHLAIYPTTLCETSNNGGDYSFQTYHDWFVRKYDGEWQFRYVENHTTSSEIEFDELTGRFQQGLGRSGVLNCNQTVSYLTDMKDEDGIAVGVMLHKIAEKGTFEMLWNENITYIPSASDDISDIEGYSEIESLSFFKRKEIVKRLKELGWERKKTSSVYLRGERKYSKGRRR